MILTQHLQIVRPTAKAAQVQDKLSQNRTARPQLTAEKNAIQPNKNAVIDTKTCHHIRQATSTARIRCT